jgi:hypothetical protein
MLSEELNKQVLWVIRGQLLGLGGCILMLFVCATGQN